MLNLLKSDLKVTKRILKTQITIKYHRRTPLLEKLLKKPKARKNAENA